jgi:hypothetical protein
MEGFAVPGSILHQDDVRLEGVAGIHLDATVRAG